METIRIDNEVVRVSDMTENAQNLVTLLEEAIEQEVQCRKDLAIREAARLELTRRIVVDHRTFKETQETSTESQENSNEGEQQG